jgi:hypothetical protein
VLGVDGSEWPVAGRLADTPTKPAGASAGIGNDSCARRCCGLTVRSGREPVPKLGDLSAMCPPVAVGGGCRG